MLRLLIFLQEAVSPAPIPCSAPAMDGRSACQVTGTMHLTPEEQIGIVIVVIVLVIVVGIASKWKTGE